MKIVAFLQNPYFAEGISRADIEKYRDDPVHRARALALSMSGRRLRKAWGDVFFFDKIHWDNANPEHGKISSDMLRADLDHMRSVIQREKPDLVICYARTAEEGMRELGLDVEYVYCRHPNSRGVLQSYLNDFAANIINKHRI